MNTEIKFRFGFKVGSTIKFKFMSLDELLDCDFALESMITQLNEDFGATHDEDAQEFECVSKDQYTGFKDIDGADIYEGDIPFCHDAYYELKKHIGGCYELHENGNDKEFFLFNHHNIVKIVGNIHQNPELIPQK
jgi:hypothetical protein